MISEAQPGSDRPGPLLRLVRSGTDGSVSAEFEPGSREVLEALGVAAYTTDVEGRMAPEPES